MSRNLRPIRQLLAGFQPHVGFLPIGTVSGKAAAPPHFAFEGARPHILHLYLEQSFDSGFHLDLVGAWRNLEAKRMLGFFFGHSLFSHQRPLDNVMNRHWPRASESFTAADCESSTRSCPSK